LSSWVQIARKHGQQPHKIVSWIRRKAGTDITVWRTLANGSFGCAAPCIFCQSELRRFDLRVHCSLSNEQWFSGRLTEPNAPAAKMTTQQRLNFGRKECCPIRKECCPVRKPQPIC